jgi:hypothetical protein
MQNDRIGTTARTGYLSYCTRLGWEFPAAILTIMFVGGVAALVGSVLTGGPWLFVVVFLCAVSYGGYRSLYHLAYIVRVNDGVLSWHGCRYHGSRPMSEVKAVTLGGFNTEYVWTFANGPSMRMIVFSFPRGLRAEAVSFLDQIGSGYPRISLPGCPGSR